MTFKVGDRVRIKPQLSGGYRQPWRGFAEKGRLGTIEAIGDFLDPFLVRFDCARKPRWPDDYVTRFRADELDLATEQEPRP